MTQRRGQQLTTKGKKSTSDEKEEGWGSMSYGSRKGGGWWGVVPTQSPHMFEIEHVIEGR